MPADLATGALAVPPEPQVGLGLHVSPFGFGSLDGAPADVIAEDDVLARLRAHAGGPVRLTRSGRSALGLVLDDLQLVGDDVVTIAPTLGTSYVSRCVTDTIAARCRWSLDVEARTRAVLAIHEWGLPHRDLGALRALDVPLIEDCAYAFASRHPDGTPVGLMGDYAIYSFPKFFSVPFGGMARGLSGVATGAQALPAVDRRLLLLGLAPELLALDDVIARRRWVWDALATAFGALGVEPFLARADGFEPGTFLFRWDERRAAPLTEVRRRFEAHGVEASVFYGSPAAYVPCHQHIGERTVGYLAGVAAGLLDGRGAIGTSAAAADAADRGARP